MATSDLWHVLLQVTLPRNKEIYLKQSTEKISYTAIPYKTSLTSFSRGMNLHDGELWKTTFTEHLVCSNSSNCKLNASLSNLTKAIYSKVICITDKSATAQNGRQGQAKSGWDHIWDAMASVSHGAYNSISMLIIFLLKYMLLTTTKHNLAKGTFLWETMLQY